MPPSPFLEQAQRDLSPWLRRNRSPVGRAECMATPPTHRAWGSCNLPNDLTTNAVPKGNSKLETRNNGGPISPQPIRKNNVTYTVDDISKLVGTVVSGGTTVGGEGWDLCRESWRTCALRTRFEFSGRQVYRSRIHP